jgi:hypothetical protein
MLKLSKDNLRMNPVHTILTEKKTKFIRHSETISCPAPTATAQLGDGIEAE